MCPVPFNRYNSAILPATPPLRLPRLVLFLARITARTLVAWGLVAMSIASPAIADAPKKVLKLSFRTAETGFDPQATQDYYSSHVERAIFDALYTFDYLARPHRIIPNTAAAMPEISADGRTWKIRIRQGIYFADDPAFKGKKRELTADVVNETAGQGTTDTVMASVNYSLTAGSEIEFLRANLKPDRLRQLRKDLGGHGLRPDEEVRTAQQRGEKPFRFSALEEKTLWGDLADTFYLVYTFSPADDPIRKTLAEHHFDAIYLDDRRMGFISEEFRSLMLEIWHVKYLQMARFREVISSIPMEIRLEHFLNDGDSPDIPIPVYVRYLNQIRDMARAPN